MILLAALYTLAAFVALVLLAAVDPRTIPPVTGTCALILTLAALGVALLH